MRNNVLAEEAEGVEHLLVLRRPEMAGLAEADIHPLAQNVERRHALRDVQR
jgi:hypothetical protein